LSSPDRDVAQQFESLLNARQQPHEPVFHEPWQAQAFALAVHLHGKGAFTWQEWSSTLAEEIRQAEALVELDDGTRYYKHWLSALERLVRERGLAEQAALDARRDDWAAAYRCTPHGKPVELRAKVKTRG
jgi:nitrile hydratase accessory protein